MEAKTKELLMVQKKIASSISYGVGNTVILKDAFGKPIPLILDLCSSPEVCRIDLCPICTDFTDRSFMTF